MTYESFYNDHIEIFSKKKLGNYTKIWHIYEKKIEELLPNYSQNFRRLHPQSNSLHIDRQTLSKIYSNKNYRDLDKRLNINSRIHLLKLLKQPSMSFHQTGTFQTPIKSNIASQKIKLSINLESAISQKTALTGHLESPENKDNIPQDFFKNSFVETQESVIDLSSFANENTMKTMKNVIDLEEKRQKMRKSLFRKRYIKDYPNDYRPKALTTNKCKLIFFILFELERIFL